MKGQWRFQRRHRPPELQCRGRSPSASGDGGQARAGGPNPTLANRTQWGCRSMGGIGPCHHHVGRRWVQMVRLMSCMHCILVELIRIVNNAFLIASSAPIPGCLIFDKHCLVPLQMSSFYSCILVEPNVLHNVVNYQGIRYNPKHTSSLLALTSNLDIVSDMTSTWFVWPS